jgi:hypothetical protein
VYLWGVAFLMKRNPVATSWHVKLTFCSILQGKVSYCENIKQIMCF